MEEKPEGLFPLPGQRMTVDTNYLIMFIYFNFFLPVNFPDVFFLLLLLNVWSNKKYLLERFFFRSVNFVCVFTEKQNCPDCLQIPIKVIIVILDNLRAHISIAQGARGTAILPQLCVVPIIGT